MRSLRIIVVMVEPPLPFGTAVARWYYVLVKGLVERGHRVTTFATCSKPEEAIKARNIFPAPHFNLHCYPHPLRKGIGAKLETLARPYSYMFGPEIRADLQRALAGEFDILHLEQLWAGWLGLDHVERALVNVHNLFWIDLELIPKDTLRKRLHYFLMVKGERQLARHFRHFRCITPRLTEAIMNANPAATVETVPLGIDPAQYSFIDHRPANRPTVSLIGSMDWLPTLSAARRLLTALWPEIKRRVPNACVQIVGWRARQALHEFLSMSDVSIEENVPDIRPYFERAGVMLYAPSRGCGMKVKIMESMLFGVPVVTTSEGVEGLITATDGIHAGVCEDDDGLIERAVRLLQDEKLQERQRIAARAMVEKHCSPEVTMDGIESIYTEMLKR